MVFLPHITRVQRGSVSHSNSNSETKAVGGALGLPPKGKRGCPESREDCTTPACFGSWLHLAAEDQGMEGRKREYLVSILLSVVCASH